jgi:hypothetical protein
MLQALPRNARRNVRLLLMRLLVLVLAPLE